MATAERVLQAVGGTVLSVPASVDEALVSGGMPHVLEKVIDELGRKDLRNLSLACPALPRARGDLESLQAASPRLGRDWTEEPLARVSPRSWSKVEWPDAFGGASAGWNVKEIIRDRDQTFILAIFRSAKYRLVVLDDVGGGHEAFEFTHGPSATDEGLMLTRGAAFLTTSYCPDTPGTNRSLYRVSRAPAAAAGGAGWKRELVYERFFGAEIGAIFEQRTQDHHSLRWLTIRKYRPVPVALSPSGRRGAPVAELALESAGSSPGQKPRRLWEVRLVGGAAREMPGWTDRQAVSIGRDVVLVADASSRLHLRCAGSGRLLRVLRRPGGALPGSRAALQGCSAGPGVYLLTVAFVGPGQCVFFEAYLLDLSASGVAGAKLAQLPGSPPCGCDVRGRFRDVYRIGGSGLVLVYHDAVGRAVGGPCHGEQALIFHDLDTGRRLLELPRGSRPPAASPTAQISQLAGGVLLLAGWERPAEVVDVSRAVREARGSGRTSDPGAVGRRRLPVHPDGDMVAFGPLDHASVWVARRGQGEPVKLIVLSPKRLSDLNF